MPDKFLSLEPDKQCVLSLDVERLASNGGERPVVVTAERGRIAVFCGAADGTWRQFERAHDALDRTPRRPESSGQFGWSRRVGIASDDSKLALVYRRRFTDAAGRTSSRRDLWIDVLALDPATETLTARAAPVAVPRGALGIDGFGLCVWADRFDNRLLLVVQAFFAAGRGPELVLLTAPFPQDDGASLAAATNWEVSTLDQGGWDFDARREGKRLFVVHRRVPAAYATDVNISIDTDFWMQPIVLSEDPARATQAPSAIAVGSLVLVEASLPDGAVQAVDDTQLFGELPQIHRVNPVVITVQRIHSVQVSLIGDAGFASKTVSDPKWKNFLVMKLSAGWRAAALLNETSGWPCRLDDMAEAHLLFKLGLPTDPRRLRLELATLFSNNPVSLFNFEEVDKDTLLTFAHSDAQFASLRATTFRVREADNGNALAVTADGTTTLDIGHRRLFLPAGNLPAEHRRFKPVALDRTRSHEDGYTLTRREPATGNALAWALAGADDKPHGFHAYVDRGDGGVRVWYDRKLAPLPPTSGPDDKTFAIDSIPEPAQSGSAWVRLETPSFVDTELASYLVQQQTPTPSLGGEIERKLDLLPGVAVLATVIQVSEQTRLIGGGELNFRPGTSLGLADVESILLNAATAGAIETRTAGFPGDLIESDTDQPFMLEFQVTPKLPVASTRIALRARVSGVASHLVTFTWTFSDGTAAATGSFFSGLFAATQHDASAAGPVRPDRDPLTITLTATTPDPNDPTQTLTNTASTSIALPASLWATLWEAFAPLRRAPDDVVAPGEDLITGRTPGFFPRDATIDLLKYQIAFHTAASGAGSTLKVSYKTSRTGRFRFVSPTEPGQGDTEYQLPIDLSLSGLKLSGEFGSFLAGLVKIDKVAAKLVCSQRFQACVQTSERQGKGTDTETVLTSPGNDTVMLPSALCCVPVGEVEIALAEAPQVTASLTDTVRNLSMLVAALVAAGLVALALAVLLPILAIVNPVIVVATPVNAGISAIVSAVIFAGLAWLATALLEAWVVRPLIVSSITSALNGDAVREGFKKSGVMTFAGEGLAEALAVRLIDQARLDGHAVAAPQRNGFDRFRPQFFEVIAVQAGRCKAKIRVL